MTAAHLHVAALPFPTHQGTQAIIRQMLEAEASDGRSGHLLTYADAGYSLDAAFEVHRVSSFPRLPSLRSGPSVAKVALDARMACSLRRCIRKLQPRMLIAHHVEAAAVCLGTSDLPVLFFAHTDLSGELPTYGPPRLSSLLRWAGAGLDRWLLRRAHGVAAISPALADQLRRRERAAADRIDFLPAPWTGPSRAPQMGQREARQALGLEPDAHWLLYAGNLDEYQDWQCLIDALSTLRARGVHAKLLVATGSDCGPLQARARQAGVHGHIATTPLDSETAREQVHAAADLTLVPRRVPGGLPIKLLDAMARGLPAVIVPHAAAGLDLEGVCQVASHNDGRALAAAAAEVLDNHSLRERLMGAGPAHVASAHSPSRYLDAIDEACARALSPRGTPRLSMDRAFGA